MPFDKFFLLLFIYIVYLRNIKIIHNFNNIIKFNYIYNDMKKNYLLPTFLPVKSFFDFDLTFNKTLSTP